MTRFNRHDLYYLAFACQLIAIGGAAFKALTGRTAFNGVLYYPFAVVAAFMFLVPPLLIFQRWMRDDFSEMLWQRTAGTVLKALIVLPLPIMIAVAVMLGTGEWRPPVTNNLIADSPLLEGVLVGFIRSILSLWLLTPVLFTFAFQWHRWRASR